MVTLKYSRIQSISGLIKDMSQDSYWINQEPDQLKRINKISFFVLNVTRHWFDYKLPKWISVVNDLQAYVFNSNGFAGGNYSFFAGNLENGFLPANLAALMEYDIPISAVGKLKSILNPNKTPEQLIMLINQLSDGELKNRGLLLYEIRKLRNAL